MHQTLTETDYFNAENARKYMSYSQFKSFADCEARALAEIDGGYVIDKQVFKEGKYFEAAICGAASNFLDDNPDMVSSRGATKGELKANYKRVELAVDRMSGQEFLMDIIKNSKRQEIITGVIGGVEFKAKPDFISNDYKYLYDLKLVKDFKKGYSEELGYYVEWYLVYGYNYQLAIYQELIRQNTGIRPKARLIAATKEDEPDLTAIELHDGILSKSLEVVEHYAPAYHKIKTGRQEPERCEKCDYCKSTKVINEFEVIYA